MTFGQPQPRPAVPAATAGKRSHARNVTLLRQLLVIGLGLALLGGLSAPLVFMGQGSAQAATQLRSGEYCDGLRAACTQTFATWRGQAVRSTLTFLPDSSWATIEGPDWWFKAWQVNPYASMAVVTIPMLPAQGTSTDPTPTLVTGATGAYNAHWKIVAQRLVATGMGAVTIRPGHELSGDWYRWSAGRTRRRTRPTGDRSSPPCARSPGRSSPSTGTSRWGPRRGMRRWPGRETPTWTASGRTSTT